MNLRNLFLLMALCVVFSCKEDPEEKEYGQTFILRTGTVCGWCSQNDTLEIKGNAVRYVNYAQCQNSNPSEEKSGKILNSEIDNLLKKLDAEEFKKLDLNSCNICVDGCDDWIYFENDAMSHYIRFSRNDSKLEPIQSFINELFVLKSKYSSGN